MLEKIPMINKAAHSLHPPNDRLLDERLDELQRVVETLQSKLVALEKSTLRTRAEPEADGSRSPRRRIQELLDHDYWLG